jgi:hypothetical protein
VGDAASSQHAPAAKPALSDQGAFDEARRSFRNAVASIFTSAILLAICTIAATGIRFSSFSNGPEWTSSAVVIGMGLQPQDGLSVVIGLATLVAALSIALVAQRPDQGTRSTPDFATHSFWADKAVSSCGVAAAVALYVVTMNLAAPLRRDTWAITFAEVMVASITLVLAAAVTRWYGSEELRRWTSERNLEAVRHFLDSSAVDRVDTCELGPRRSKYPSVVRYAVFVVVAGTLATASAYALAHLTALVTNEAEPSPRAGRIPIAIGGISAIVWLRVAIAQAKWRSQLSASRVDRFASYFNPIMIQLLLLSFALSAFAAFPSRVVVVFVTSLWLGLGPATSLGLWLGHKYYRGPARFVLERLVKAAKKRAAALEKELRD